MAFLKCVAVLVLFSSFQTASLQEVEMMVREDDGRGKNVKVHDIRVQCPQNCTDKVSFELDCFSGDLSTTKSATEFILMLEKKVSVLEKMLMPPESEQVYPTGGRDITAKIRKLEDKVDRIVQCLLEH